MARRIQISNYIEYSAKRAFTEADYNAALHETAPVE